MTETTYLTLGQAAKETGKSKATISKALKDGKISYIEKTKAGYKIDPSELFRVFDKHSINVEDERSQTLNVHPENSVLQARLDAAEQRYSDAEKTIEDLRERLTQSDNRLTAILLDQRTQNEKGFFKRLFG